MMWNACAKRGRLENAMRLRGIDPEQFSLRELDRALVKRGITDSQLSPIVSVLIDVLEPPGCKMTHCKFHGGTRSPMNCADGRTPGRCKINKDYLKRQRARTAKDWRNILNDDARSIKYGEMSSDEALNNAALAADELKRRAYTAGARKRYDIALEGARAELSDQRTEEADVRKDD